MPRHSKKATSVLTPQECAKAIALLQQTEAQLNFKPAADKWSMAECIKHIAAAEKELWAMAEPALTQPAKPEKRAELKFSDDDLIKAVEDRTHKSKTFAALEPANSPYQTAAKH